MNYFLTFKSMKKQLGLILIICLFLIKAEAQQLLGVANSNFAGTHALHWNPANVADNRHVFFMNLFTVQSHFNNNLFKWTGKSPFSFISDASFDDKDIQQINNDRKRLLQFGAQARFALMIDAGNVGGFAFGIRARGDLSGNNISPKMFDLLKATDLSDPIIANQAINNTTFSGNANIFSEYALTYGRTVFDNDEHLIKAGISLKYMTGLYSAHAINRELDYFVNDSPMPGQDFFRVDNLNGQLGYSTVDIDFDGAGQFFGSRPNGSGFGTDLGLVYEWRPDIYDHYYEMDGEELLDKRAVKYKLRVGLALTDLGFINYKKNTVRAYNFQVAMRSINENNLSNIDNLEDLITELGVDLNNFKPRLRSGLPTTVNLNVDYQIIPKLFLNLAYFQNLKGKFNIASRQLSLLALTPRFETHGFEFAMPLSFQNNISTFAWGAAFKFGPVFIGTDNIAGLINAGDPRGADIYFGINIPVRHKKIPSDVDEDGVSDKMDECIEVPGTLEMKGCPDKDGDKITDAKDKCPDEAGLADMEGCPDKDGDKITDKEDACPENFGPTEFKGCPDTDGDKIIDKEDECPEKPGWVNYKGCPDSDGDKIPDNKDKCPNQPGILVFEGCADTDNDGIPDPEDGCPSIYGPKTNKGCPEVKKVEVAPVLSVEEKEKLREAFEDLEFEEGKAVIAEKSKPSLRELADVLWKKPQFRLRISGHTDNVGYPAANLKLSQDRANAVKKYLMSQGVPEKQLIAEGFGQTKPIASNATAAGRQKNRRVELKVVK